jgi:GGDEF domain-containing protein
MPVVVAGQAGVGDASDLETWVSDEQGVFQVRTELWWAEGGNEAHGVARAAIRGLVSAWWRGDGRNEKSRLPSGQSVATQRALEETVRSWLADGPVVFCAADIDNFGNYNNHLGLPAGDDLIARLGAALVERTPRDCLVVHRSGDEFSLLFPPTTAPGHATALVMAIREEVEAVLRDGVDIDPLPGLSMGLATCAQSMGYAELEDLAGKALKPDGQKRRGRVTVLRPEAPPLVDGVSPIDLQLLIALNLLGETEPFRDPLLDAASIVAHRLSAEAPDLQTLAQTLPAALSRFAESDVLAPPPDAVIAAAHGVARAGLAGTGAEELDRIKVLAAGEVVAVLAGEAGVLVAGALPEAEARSVVVRGAEPHLATVDSKRAVLVTIGDSELGLPPELFAAVVFVDERPTKGGGLPDLWEAAVAQVVACVAHHPNVARVFLAGNLDMGTQTVTRLHNSAEWTAPEHAEALARRLGAPSMSRIAETGERIAGRVIEVASAVEIIGQMIEDQEVGVPVRPTADAAPAPEPPRLRRVLSMDDMLPDKEYGCRLATASEAFRSPSTSCGRSRTAPWRIRPVGRFENSSTFGFS